MANKLRQTMAITYCKDLKQFIVQQHGQAPHQAVAERYGSNRFLNRLS